MAYFPNGATGEMYEEKYCSKCVHDITNSCSVLLLHLIHNYDQLKDGNEDMRKALSILIPMKDGQAEKCTMFVDRRKEKVINQEEEFYKLEHWNAGTPIRG